MHVKVRKLKIAVLLIVAFLFYMLLYTSSAFAFTWTTETRDEMIAIAGPFTKVPWSLVTPNNSSYDDKGKIKYKIKEVYGSYSNRADAFKSGKYTGEAYSFGNADNIKNFFYRVNTSKLTPRNWAGSGKDYLKETTGIDCSAYVSIIWKIPRTGTSGLAGSTYSSGIDISTVKKGDIFNKSLDHTVLVYSGPYGTYKNQYNVYQAAGSIHKVGYTTNWLIPKDKYGNYTFSARRRKYVSDTADTEPARIQYSLPNKSGATVWGEKFPISMQVRDDKMNESAQLGVPDSPQKVEWRLDKQGLVKTDTWGIARNDLLGGNVRKFGWDLPVISKTFKAGNHSVYVTAYDWKGNKSSKKLSITRQSSSRIYGSEQWGTMKAITKNGWPYSSDFAVLTTYKEYYDSVVATPLASWINAPILFTDEDNLSQASADEIKRLGVDGVLIVGGTDVISKDVEYDIKNINSNIYITRYAGSNAQDTAARVANKIYDLVGNYAKAVFIVPNQRFAENGMAVSAVAGDWGAPILYTYQSYLPIETENVIRNHYSDGTSIIIIGDTNAISSAVEKKLNDIADTSIVDRPAPFPYWDGQTMSQFLSDVYGYNDPSLSRKTYISRGDISFSGQPTMDALGGAALASKNFYSLILPSYKSTELQFFEFYPKNSITLLGGPLATYAYYHYSEGTDYPALNILSSSARIFSSTSTSSYSIGKVYQHQRYVPTPDKDSLIDENDNYWREIYFKGQKGWILEKNTQNIIGERVIELTKDEQAVYSGPSDDLDEIGKAHAPERYVGQDEDGWSAIYYDGGFGFIPPGSYKIAQLGPIDKEAPEITMNQPSFANREQTTFTVSINEPIDESTLAIEAKDSTGRLVSARITTESIEEPAEEEPTGDSDVVSGDAEGNYEEGDADDIDIIEEEPADTTSIEQPTDSYDEEIIEEETPGDSELGEENQSEEQQHFDYTVVLDVDDQTAEGALSIKVSAKDLAGNLGEASSTTVVDASTPITSLTTDKEPYASDQGSFASLDTVYHINAADSYSGVDSAYLSIDDAPLIKIANPTSFKLTKEGKHTITYYSVDKIANTEDKKTYEVTVDGTPPDTTSFIDPSKGQNAIPKSLTTLTAKDPGQIPSGINKIEYKIDDGGWQPYILPFTFEDLSLGTHTLSFRATDNVSNQEEIKSQVFTVSPPIIASITDKTSDPRVLVWLNYNDEINNQIDKAKIEDLLKTSGAFYFDFATDKEQFQSLLRSNLFTTYLIFGNQQPLTDHLSGELREQINLGKTVVSSLYHKASETPVKQNNSSDSGNGGDELFGVKVVGKLSGENHNITLDYTDSENEVSKSFDITGAALKIEPLIEESPTVSGTIDDTQFPSMVTNTFGKGSTTFLAFDIKEMLNSADLSAVLTSLLKSSYLQTSTDSTLDTEAKLIKLFAPAVPLDIKLIQDQQSKADILVPPIPTDMHLEDNQEKELKLLINKPEEENKTIDLNILYGLRGQLTFNQNLSSALESRLSFDSLKDEIVGQLDELSLNDADQSKVDQIKTTINQLNLTDVNVETASNNILDLLKAIDQLNKMQIDFSDIRLNMDRLIIVLERVVWKT